MSKKTNNSAIKVPMWPYIGMISAAIKSILFYSIGKEKRAHHYSCEVSYMAGVIEAFRNPLNNEK